MINVEEKKQRNPRPKYQSNKVESRRQIPRTNIYKNGLKQNKNLSKSEPANKDKTKHSSKNATAAQHNQAPINVPAKPVKMSYANILQKEGNTINLPVEKPKNHPEVCLF